MVRIFGLLLILVTLGALPAFAQGGVVQAGPVVPGHLAAWGRNGVVLDAGLLGSLSPMCVNDVPASGPLPISVPYHQTCLTATVSGGQLTYTANNGAAPLPFDFIVNGQDIPLSSLLTPASVSTLPSPTCVVDATITGPFHQTCIQATSTGGVISYNALNGAAPLPLSFQINGNNVPFASLGTNPQTLINKTIVGGALDDISGNLITTLGNAGSNPTWYPPTGTRSYASMAISSNTYGYGNQAQGLSVYLNQPQLTVDDGCALGGFGANQTSRGYVASSDQVAFCEMATMALPLATLTYNASGATDFTLSNDPAATEQQFYTTSFGATPVYSGSLVQLTKVNFTAPLSASAVQAMRVNMFVRMSTGWTGFLKAWDPAGNWLTVDAWVNATIGTPVYVGYSPLPSAFTPIGTPATTATMVLNANQQLYGENDILTMPAGVYCLFGYACGMEGKELTMINNGKPFVRGGGACPQGQESTCTTNEYTPFNDSPRNVGMLLGAGGPYATSAMYAVYGGPVDKSFVAGEGQYAGFLVSPYGDFPIGAGFMSQQATGVAFAAKNPTVQDYTFQVDARTGTIQQGGQGTAVSTIRGTLSLQTSSNSVVQLTKDGATPASNGSNLPVFIPPSSSVDLVARLQISNSADSGRQLTYEIECLYRRVGSAAPTVAQSADTPKLPNVGTSGYNQACGVDPTNSYGEIVVTQTTGLQANYIASYTATVGPL
jgi:hypothetical protein